MNIAKHSLKLSNKRKEDFKNTPKRERINKQTKNVRMMVLASTDGFLSKGHKEA